MINRCLILLLLLVACHGKLLLAQSISRYNTFSYSVNEGLLQPTIGDMEVDRNNFLWLSFPNGLQKFDGKNFATVPVQPGLPDDKFINFFRCSNGDLLISHSQGISKYEITASRFAQIYSNTDSVNTPARFIGEDENIVYFYTENGYIKGMNSTDFKVVSALKPGLPYNPSNVDYSPVFSDNIINHKIAININSSFYLWDLKNKKLLNQSAPVPYISRFTLRLKNETEVLYYNYKTNNALQLYNFATNNHRSLVVKGKDDKQIGRCVILPWQNKRLISFTDRLYETDETFQILKTELVNFQNQPVAGNQGIGKIIEDNFGNLFIQTIKNGIRKIIRNNYPIKYFGTEKKEENFVISILPDKKNNRILAGTAGNGLLIFDTLQRLVKHIKTFPGRNKPASPNSIIKMNDGNYLLFAVGEKQVWKLSPDLSKLGSISIATGLPADKSGIDYFGNLLFQNEKEAVVQSQDKLYKINFASNTVTEHQVTTTYTMSGIFYNGMIITHANDKLFYLDAVSFKEVKKIPFKNTGYVRCFAISPDNNIYVGSNKGIFIIDSSGKVQNQLNKETGLPDECIYAMSFDAEGFLWCSTNKGILKINKDKSILQLKKEDGLQENEFNTSAVAKAKDGELFFGGVNGVSSFYPAAISSYEENLSLLFTRIKANNKDVMSDSAPWGITKINLPYHQNALSFDFLAMGNNNPDQYIYQYRMDEVDKEWIQNNDLQSVRYSLPPGKYTFKIYASRSFDKDAKAIKEIQIIILPPFWKSWWFGLLSAVTLIGLLAYFINQRNKKKYAAKLQQLENERKLEQERERISKDLHDSLGAYANAVLYNTELLEKEKTDEKIKELIGDLKFASKDIITSLRETVWALKKESYTAEDCLVRIKNFIQPLAKYYNQINFRVEGEAPPGMELHYSKALNLVRIIQEAISNSIKHASPGNIILFTNFIDNKWKLTIADDGKGFDYMAMKEQERGNGLNNIEHRSAESGFVLSIQTEEQKGTLITIIV